jgi:hypothetical protein
VSDSHYSYQVQPTTGDNTESQTPAQREAQSASLRQPGRAIFDGNGYRVEQIQEVNAAPAANEDRSSFWNYATTEDGTPTDMFAPNANPSRIYIPVPDGRGGWDRMTLAAATRGKVIQKDGSGKYVPFGNPEPSADAKSQESQENKSAEKESQQTDDNSPLRWESEAVDRTMSTLGRELSETQIEGMIAVALTGSPELTNLRAESIAQTLENVSADEVKEAYRVMVQEATAKADEIVLAAGLSDPGTLYRHLEANDLPRLRSIQDAFVRGDARPLEQAAKQFLGKNPDAGVSQSSIEAIMAEGNEVNGGKLHRNEKGTALVTFDSGETMTLASALRAGYVKIS